MEFEWFVIVVAIVVAMLIFSMSASRRGPRWRGMRMCNSCGAAHPPFAQFCRRCGQRLL